MPIVAQPALIEVSDFSQGWVPDGANDAMDPSALLESSNWVLDRNTQSLNTRPGYAELDVDWASMTDLTADHFVRQLYHFNAASDSHLIVVFTDLTTTADNVQLYDVHMDDLSVHRIDTAGVTWSNPESMFWFIHVDHILYGGSRGNAMFSWTPSTDTWDDDASTPNTKTWVDDDGASVTTATQYARDYAFTGKEFVLYSGDIYQPLKKIRYPVWKVDQHYDVGDKVTRKNDSYPSSYRCIKAHTSDGTTNRPNDGSSYTTYWKKIRLDDILDEDGDVTDDWAFIPSAPQTDTGTWYGDRLFLRQDRHRVLYSAPVKPDTSKDITDTQWNPKDWAPGNDLKGPGGGWVPVDDGAISGDIMALHAFGQYLIILKASSIWVISGVDDTTWTVRRVGRGHGAVGPLCVVEQDGLVYFLSQDGLFATDGTAVQEVPGNEKVQRWLTNRIDECMTQAETDGMEPQMFTWNGFVGISLPNAADVNQPHLTLLYDPMTQSFWPLDLPMLDFVRFSANGVINYFFCRSLAGVGDSPRHAVYSWTGDLDDDGGADEAAIFAYLRTAWLPFGTAHNERRVRKTWVVAKSAVADDWTLEGYSDFDATTPEYQVTRNTVSTFTQHLEGRWFKDSHAVQFYVDVVATATARLFGYAVETEPRRRRYHA